MKAIPYLLGVRVARQDGKRTVDLFGEHGAGEFVRESERGKRELLRGAAAQRFRKTLRSPAKENDFTNAAIARFAQPARKLRRSLGLTRIVEQNNGGGGIESQLSQGCRGVLTQFRHLHLGKSPNARGIVIEQGANFRPACFSEHDEVNFHRQYFTCGILSATSQSKCFERSPRRRDQFNPYFLRLSRRVLRLMPRIWAVLPIL